MRLYKRERYLSKMRAFFHDDDLIKVITGIRRCGKSSLMQTIAEELKEGGVAENNIIYIDLDKRGYKSIRNAEQLDALIESATQAKGMKYLFIDEIQNVEGFEEVINGFRSEGDYSIFITGSNSYLLSLQLNARGQGLKRYSNYFPNGIYGLKFECTATATGSRNMGRLSIDDIVFGMKAGSNDNNYYITNYRKTVA